MHFGLKRLKWVMFFIILRSILKISWQLFWGKYLKNTSKKGDKDAKNKSCLENPKDLKWEKGKEPFRIFIMAV